MRISNVTKVLVRYGSWSQLEWSRAATTAPYVVRGITPFGHTDLWVYPTGREVVVTRQARPAGRIARRIVRYATLVLGMFGGGLLAGYYLTMAKATAVSAVISVAGSIHVTRMVAADLEALGLDDRWARRAIGALAGSYASLIPVLGATTGLFAWFGRHHISPFRRYVRRRIIAAGRRGLTGF